MVTHQAPPMAAPPPTSAAPYVAPATAGPATGALGGVVDDVDDPVASAESSDIAGIGTVKWFSSEKAYGFIAGDDGTDVFVHQSAITAGGLRSLKPGQRVRYEEKRSPKGPFAAIVRAAP
jgi:CspA family cold shock protein